MLRMRQQEMSLNTEEIIVYLFYLKFLLSYCSPLEIVRVPFLVSYVEIDKFFLYTIVRVAQ